VVLEVGAGSGKLYPHGLRGTAGRLVGIDPSQQIGLNQQIDHAVMAWSERLPFPADTFDVIFSRSVAEHFSDPVASFGEIARVLKPGGVVLTETPNLLYYPMIISRFTPVGFHRWCLSKLRTRPDAEEVFPSFYRVNTGRAIRRVLAKCGLEIVAYELLSTPPGYLRFSRLAFFLGSLYERTFERAFPNLRARIFVIARKSSMSQRRLKLQERVGRSGRRSARSEYRT
jgi:SAM-dependent methyltransferase